MPPKPDRFRTKIPQRPAGRSDHGFVQEIYSFEHAGATWLLVLQHEPGQPRPLRDRLLASFRFLGVTV